ncbi:Hpt domain-containing protein [Algoriphagus namhaensis]
MYQSIDEDTIYNYLGRDNPDLIRELLGLILSVNLRELEELQELYPKEDYSTIKKRVHKSKPSLSYVGASKALELVHQIEEDLENSAPLNEELQAQVKRIRVDIQLFLDNL